MLLSWTGAAAATSRCGDPGVDFCLLRPRRSEFESLRSLCWWESFELFKGEKFVWPLKNSQQTFRDEESPLSFFKQESLKTRNKFYFRTSQSLAPVDKKKINEFLKTAKKSHLGFVVFLFYSIQLLLAKVQTFSKLLFFSSSPASGSKISSWKIKICPTIWVAPS